MNRIRKRRLRRARLRAGLLLLAAAAGGILGTGCTPAVLEFERLAVSDAEVAGAVADAPAWVEPHMRRLLEEGERNETLNRMRLGLTAFERGADGLAAEQLDLVIASIQRVRTSPDLQRDLDRNRVVEVAKSFRGEPYERSMAFWYRGLLLLEQGRSLDARAHFLAGLFEDSWAEDEAARSDFAVLAYLAGWAARAAGEEAVAAEDLAAARGMNPRLLPPAPGHNAIVIVETGRSPRKLLDGVGQYRLVFRRGRDFADESARLLVDGAARPLTLAESVHRQASTRGTREIDHVLAGGAIEFAEASRFAADAASLAQDVSQFVWLDPSGVAAGISGVGAIASISAIASQVNNTPMADARCWDGLPDAIHVATLALEEGTTLLVQLLDDDGRPVGSPRPATRATWSRIGGVYWFKAHPSPEP